MADLNALRMILANGGADLPTLNAIRQLLDSGAVMPPAQGGGASASFDPAPNAMRDVLEPPADLPSADYGRQAPRDSVRSLEQSPGLAQQSSAPTSSDDLRRQGAQFVRNETTGQTIYFGPNGQASDRPSQVQSQQSQAPRMMQVIGTGGGTRVTLPPEQAPDKVNLDYSRSPLQVMGGAKAIYSKDEPGVAYVLGSDGRPVSKVLLGYDMQGSMLLNRANLEQDQTRAQIAHTNEQIAASQAARNQKEGIPGAGIPQSVLEKQYGKAPQGQRWTLDGQLEDIPGGSGKALTESQGKAAGLASRAQEAHNILSGLEGQGVLTPGLIKQGAEAVPLVGGALAMGVNKLPAALGGPSSDQQKVEQAQRDFVNAALRVESGASISQSEFDNARKQYFPQPGDSPEVIQQKQQAREREIRSLAIQAGPGANRPA
jgi:hypothetical protein